MRCLTLLLILSVALPVYADRQASRLTAPPPRTTLPIVLVKTIKAQSLTVGQPVTARLFQRVPVSVGTYLLGGVYDQYSQPVGYADLHGVHAEPTSAGKLPRAMGPFSTTATGLHGLPGFSVLSP